MSIVTRFKLYVIGAMFIAFTPTVNAQWLNHPTPGLPRDADGKPNLTAATPRTAGGKPDFSGVWTGPRSAPNIAPADVQPWVNEAARRHAKNYYKEGSMFRCQPSGPATFDQSTGDGVWKRIVQTPNLIVILNDDLTFRQVFMDGRKLEANPFPSWMGYSVGRWEGETLVVDSFGFNDKTWLNTRGVQHTEALHMTERYTRQDVGHLKIEVSYSDPGAYLEPLAMRVDMTLGADTELLERVCESGSDQWAGTTADAINAAVKVSREILARYVGVYSGYAIGPLTTAVPIPRRVEATVVNGQLVIRINDDPKPLPLTPLSETLFESEEGLLYDFIISGSESATDVVEIRVSGGYKYPRRQ